MPPRLLAIDTYCEASEHDGSADTLLRMARALDGAVEVHDLGRCALVMMSPKRPSRRRIAWVNGRLPTRLQHTALAHAVAHLALDDAAQVCDWRSSDSLAWATTVVLRVPWMAAKGVAAGLVTPEEVAWELGCHPELVQWRVALATATGLLAGDVRSAVAECRAHALAWRELVEEVMARL